MSASNVLEHTAEVLDDRRAAYGPPMEAMAAIAARCTIDLKLARLQHDQTYRDGVTDVIGYAALLPEVSP